VTVHRDYFFDSVRFYLAGGSLTPPQVDGATVLLDWYDTENPPLPDRHHLDDRMFAYCLATAWHETAFTLQPVKEYGGEDYLRSKPYYPWYGRGYVQLTWEANYQTQDTKLGLGGGLMQNPDLALEPTLATKILLLGMADGDFTGKRLGQYFTDELTDWYNARRIVNGTDKANEIAAYGEKFHNALGHI
jgi:putative chitinase